MNDGADDGLTSVIMGVIFQKEDDKIIMDMKYIQQKDLLRISGKGFLSCSIWGGIFPVSFTFTILFRVMGQERKHEREARS